MTNIHLFGSSNPTGNAFQAVCQDLPFQYNLYVYSRVTNNRFQHSPNVAYVDYSKPSQFNPIVSLSEPSVWISFSPIWIFSQFLSTVSSVNPFLLDSIDLLLVCSSSSASTKSFASNSFDQELASRLKSSEDKLFSLGNKHNFKCSVVRPSLVYGHSGQYQDNNLSVILSVLRYSPFIILPYRTGLRQPIHCKQLASVFFTFLAEFVNNHSCASIPSLIEIGGDTTLSYASMIDSLQSMLKPYDLGRFCSIIKVPNRLFFFLFSFVLLLSPKWFEALFRISSNLSGFTPVSRVTKLPPIEFPVIL